MSASVWDTALNAARDILSDLAGEVLGWAIVLALLAPLLLILYFVLKKMGYGRYYRGANGKTRSFQFRFGATQRLAGPETKIEIVDPQGKVQVLGPGSKVQIVSQSGELPPPEAPAQLQNAGVPGWQREMQEAWDREAAEKTQAFADTLEDRKRKVLKFYTALVYLGVGALLLGSLYFFIRGARGQSELYIVALVLLGTAGAAWASWDPSRFE